MKKLLIALVVVVVLGAVAVVGLAFFVGNAITAGVNKYGPGITQTKLTLAGANVSAFSGVGTLKGLVVGNPQGWSDRNLCELGEIHVRLEPRSVLGDHIIIHEIRIDAAQINYESKLVASNVGDLLKNIEASTGGPKPAAEKPAEPAGPPARFEVRKFSFTNGSARVSVAGKEITLPLPPIELNDLGTKEGGITAQQMAQAVAKSVTNSVLAAVAKNPAALSGEGVIDTAKKAGEAIKGIFGGKKN